VEVFFADQPACLQWHKTPPLRAGFRMEKLQNDGIIIK